MSGSRVRPCQLYPGAHRERIHSVHHDARHIVPRGANRYVGEADSFGHGGSHRVEVVFNKEVGMSLAEEFRNEGEIRGVVKGKIEGEIEGEIKGKIKGKIEGKIEGKVEGELTRGRRILSNFLALIPASLRDHYSEQLTNAQTIEELDRLEAEILQLSSQSA